MAAPEVPVRAAQLPRIAAGVLRRLNFRHLRFTLLSIISESDLVDHGG